jgi:hypothetical protein
MEKQATGVCKRLSIDRWRLICHRWKNGIVRRTNLLIVCVLHSFSAVLLPSGKQTIGYGTRVHWVRTMGRMCNWVQRVKAMGRMCNEVERLRTMGRMCNSIFRDNIVHA